MLEAEVEQLQLDYTRQIVEEEMNNAASKYRTSRGSLLCYFSAHFISDEDNTVMNFRKRKGSREGWILG